jgi:hypothetical protein
MIDQKLTAFSVAFSATITGLVETITNKMVTELTEKMIQPYSVKIEELNKENQELRARIESTEVHSRRNSLIIHGIPEATAQDFVLGPHSGTALGHQGPRGFHQTEELIVGFCNDNLDLPVTIQDVSFAHRLPRGKMDKHRPIIVTFTSHRIKEDVYGSRRRLRTLHSGSNAGAPVFINEHLTKLNAQIFAGTRQLLKGKKITGTWTSGGIVYYMKSASAGEKPARIETLDELQKLQESLV